MNSRGSKRQDAKVQKYQTLECAKSDSSWKLYISRLFNKMAAERCGTSSRAIPIDSKIIEDLVMQKFSIPKIAKYFDVSVKTIKRRMKDAGISIKSTYAVLDDQELDELVAKTILENPNLGIRLLKGVLWSQQKLRIPEQRLRECMRRVDPVGVENRLNKNRAVNRRVYNVPYANYLWHIDGNLKLVRYKMTIRAGIDGKSRLNVYLEVGSDNKASSSLDSFMNGVRRYGVPTHTRTDKGGENILVARFMVSARGLNAHFTGRSVHNQRVERYWRDVTSSVTTQYIQTFASLEAAGELNVDNDITMSVLHHVFIPRINKALEGFRLAWNDHPLSTEKYNTPNQLFILNGCRAGREAFSDVDLETLFRDTMLYAPSNEPIDNIRNPAPPRFSIPADVLERLTTVDLLRESQSNGADVYLECLRIVEQNLVAISQ